MTQDYILITYKNMESCNKNVTPGGILTSAIIGSVAPVIPQPTVHVTPAGSHGIMLPEGEELHCLCTSCQYREGFFRYCQH